MIYKKLFISLILPTAIFAKEIQIKITDSNVSKPKVFALAFLREDGAAIFCHTHAIPDHKVDIAWLKSLAIPKDILSAGKRNCERTVHWGKATFCESPANQYKLNELLRWCSQI